MADNNIYKIYEVVVGKSKFKAKQFKNFNYSSTEVSANEQVYLAQIEKVFMGNPKLQIFSEFESYPSGWSKNIKNSDNEIIWNTKA